MDLYKAVSYDVSKLVTERYSTSFSMSTRLFDAAIRRHIYAIYGLVRIADEVVDTYHGADAKEILDSLERATYDAIDRGYDTNPVVHAFALTAKKYSIGCELLSPFFESMRMDLEPKEYTDELYSTYIHGSAEVIGLMCLRVFCENNEQQYDELKSGAMSLGAAYQKINFLRDVAADYNELGRLYFPGVEYDRFSSDDVATIVADIESDIMHARSYVDKLPHNSRRAVRLSLKYYGELLDEIKRTSPGILKTKRIRVSATRKIWLYVQIRLGAIK